MRFSLICFLVLGFYVYIDESGDEGFVFPPSQSPQQKTGSSEWFVLSAVITREVNDKLTTRSLLDRVRSALPTKKPNHVFHFQNMKHEHRLPLVEAIGTAPLRLINVMVHKPSLEHPEKFSDKYRLYYYCCRLLLERVSWLCRDTRHDKSHYARVVFSNRNNMSYDELRNYIERLKCNPDDFQVTIDWSTINTNEIISRTHDSMAGLQIADAVASSFWNAVELRRGFTEPRYAKMLHRVLYRHRRVTEGYGIKTYPNDLMHYANSHAQWTWLSEHANKKTGPGLQDPTH